MNPNYECEIDEILSKKLQEFYGVKKFSVAYRIFLIRFLIEHMEVYRKSKQFDRQELERLLPRFLVAELNLPLADGKLIYKGVEIKLYRSSENSLANILDNWAFQNTFEENKKGEIVLKTASVEREFKKILSAAEKMTKVNKTHPSYLVYLKHNCLSLLNASYNIKSRSIGRIEGFLYGENHNDFALTLEEKYERLIHPSLMDGSISKLSEEKLEEYLAGNLHQIEEGLTLVGRQLPIDNGRLDILAKDKNGNYCIIELKVEDDTDICWQCLYYPIAVKERFHCNPRMIVVAPELSSHILKPLKTLEGVEIYMFKAKMEFDRIASLNLKKIA